MNSSLKTTFKSTIELKFASITTLSKISAASDTFVAGFCAETKSKDKKVIGVSSSQKSTGLKKIAEHISKKLKLETKAGASLFVAEPSEATRAGIIDHDSFLAVCSGTAQDCQMEGLVSLGGKIAEAFKANSIESADVYVDSFLNSSSNSKDKPVDFAKRPHPSGAANLEQVTEGLISGLALGLYSFNNYKSKPKDKKFSIRVLSSKLSAKQGKEIVERLNKVIEAVYITRDLQNTPGSDLYPALLAKKCQELSKNGGFSVKVMDEKKLKASGFNGIVSVGKGSINQPRLIAMEYNATKKNLPTLVLVGKGVTFDTGGVCLKPAPGMEAMKMDMSGAASVIGAMTAIANLKVPVRVIGLVGAAENVISERATLPGDIYKSLDGKTVEVLNTDAEGRLVLADLLTHAKTYKPDMVVNLATLTGAILVALGGVSTGIFGNDDKALEKVKKASAKAGERVWELPIYDQYMEDMKSTIADLRNIGSSRNAGSSKAAAFLNYFVEGAYPWVHMDIAGTAMNAAEQGPHCPKNSGTGVPVRSLVALAETFKK